MWRILISIAVLAVSVSASVSLAIEPENASGYDNSKQAYEMLRKMRLRQMTDPAEIRKRKERDEADAQLKVQCLGAQPRLWHLGGREIRGKLIGASPLYVWLEASGKEKVQTIKAAKAELRYDDQVAAWRASVAAVKRAKVAWPKDAMEKPATR